MNEARNREKIYKIASIKKKPKFHMMAEIGLKYEHVNKHFRNISETIKVCQVAFFIRIPFMLSQFLSVSLIASVFLENRGHFTKS